MNRFPSILSSCESCESNDALPSQSALLQLAHDDPQAFESLRAELIDSAILRAPASLQLRLRQLQFRVDGVRRLARTPLGALIRMQAMMWDSFLELNEALQRLEALTRTSAAPQGATGVLPGDAVIIDFRTRRQREG